MCLLASHVHSVPALPGIGHAFYVDARVIRVLVVYICLYVPRVSGGETHSVLDGDASTLHRFTCIGCSIDCRRHSACDQPCTHILAFDVCMYVCVYMCLCRIMQLQS